MDMCISQREELEIRPWELKGERLKRLRVKGEKLRVKGERLWVKDNNRVASVLQNFDQEVLFPSVRVFSTFGLW